MVSKDPSYSDRDPGANWSPRDPGQLARFDMSGAISTDVPAYAIDTGQAARALAEVAGGLSDTLGKMVAKARKREGVLAGMAHVQQNYPGWESGQAYLQQQAAIGEASGVAGTGPWHEQAKALLRKEEGFRDTPYMDVTAHRVGYGSDTTVTADGKIVRVTPGMRISREDAERDLDYRLTQREGLKAQQQLGDAWGALPDRAKAGLVSVAYNYGSLPSSVVAAARSGDLNATAAAVAALPANSKRRAREAALIRGGGPSSAVDPLVTGSTSPADKPPAEVALALSTQPLALRRDGTIFGDAFDDAALSAWSWRMQEGVSSELFAAQLEHQDDPNGFAAAAAEIRNKYAGELPNDPQARELFEQDFARNARAYGMNIAARHETRLRQEQEAAFSAGLAARTVDIERQAQVLGANPEGDAIIGEQVATMHRSIDGAVTQGIITPAQAEKEKEAIAKTAAFGRVQGVYEALPTPEAKEQFALELLEDWRAGEGPLANLPFAEVKARSDYLFNDAREQINRRTAANKTEVARLETLVKDDVASIAASGKGLDPATSGLSVDQVQAIAGDEAVAAWQAEQARAHKLYSATNGMELQSEADLAERLNVMRPAPGRPGYLDEIATWEAARKRAEEVLKERQTDPLGQAARGGAIELAPIDPSSSDALAQSLITRRTQRNQVAGLYQQDVSFFRPGEKEMLASALNRQPELLPDFAQTVARSLGSEAPRVLAELSADAPVIAHAAGLTLAGGDASVANDIATALALKRDKTYTLKMPAADTLDRLGTIELGGALSGSPATRGAILQTAAILFEQAANAEGFDPDAIKTEGSPAQAAYFRALDRAAGGRRINGVDFGGLSAVNGFEIIVPADMQKDRPQELLEGLTPETLTRLPPVGTANGIAVDASQIRRGVLVSAGDGLYRVALGDPSGDDPRFLITPDGRPWTLDIRALDSLSRDPAVSRIGGFNPLGWQPERRR